MANLVYTHTPTEFSQAGGPKIDDKNGIIYGVSVITEGEAKGHGLFVDSKSLQTTQAATKSHTGGVACKADHGSGVFEIIGHLKEFRVDGQKLRADLHLLKQHPRYASVLELAKTNLSGVGLSISFSYAPEIVDEKVFIRIKSLFSIDLVDGPACNPTGLFSQPNGPSPVLRD